MYAVRLHSSGSLDFWQLRLSREWLHGQPPNKTVGLWTPNRLPWNRNTVHVYGASLPGVNTFCMAPLVRMQAARTWVSPDSTWCVFFFTDLAVNPYHVALINLSQGYSICWIPRVQAREWSWKWCQKWWHLHWHTASGTLSTCLFSWLLGRWMDG